MKSTPQQLKDIADAVIGENIDPIEACRKLVDLYEPGLYPEEILMAMKGIESETDDFPIGSARQTWDSSSLREKDREKEIYLADHGSIILDLCRRISNFLEHATK